MGESFTKMLLVSIDVAYPSVGLMASLCFMGPSSLPPLIALIGQEAEQDPRCALMELTRKANGSTNVCVESFWGLIEKFQAMAQDKFYSLPLLLEQLVTPRGKLSAVTMEAQLAEYGHFRNRRARLRFGLDGDSSMRPVDWARLAKSRPLSLMAPAPKRTRPEMPGGGAL